MLVTGEMNGNGALNAPEVYAIMMSDDFTVSPKLSPIGPITAVSVAFPASSKFQAGTLKMAAQHGAWHLKVRHCS